MAGGRLFYALITAMAEFEREPTRERTRAGMAVRGRKVRLGRPAALTPEKIDLAKRLLAEGKGKAIVARMVGVDPATLRRALNSC